MMWADLEMPSQIEAILWFMRVDKIVYLSVFNKLFKEKTGLGKTFEDFLVLG